MSNVKNENMDDKKVLEQMRTLLHEFRILSGKKPNEPINVFKLKYVNKTLEAANDVLGDDKPYDDFEKFSEEDLPTNSDVLMILSLYLDRMHV